MNDVDQAAEEASKAGKMCNLFVAMARTRPVVVYLPPLDSSANPWREKIDDLKEKERGS